MTEKQLELYNKTVKRLARGGMTDPTAQIIALAEEIEHYRARISGLLERLEEEHQRYRSAAGVLDALAQNSPPDRIRAGLGLEPLNKTDEATLARMEIMPK